MILKSKQDLMDLNPTSKIYVAHAPKLEVFDTMFLFNTSANINTYHPVYAYMKVGTMEFKPVKDGIKRSYDMNIADVIESICAYENYHTHDFYASTSERETLQLLNKSRMDLIETVKRAQVMVDRMSNDFLSSKIMTENREDFPEDWV